MSTFEWGPPVGSFTPSPSGGYTGSSGVGGIVWSPSFTTIPPVAYTSFIPVNVGPTQMLSSLLGVAFVVTQTLSGNVVTFVMHVLGGDCVSNTYTVEFLLSVGCEDAIATHVLKNLWQQFISLNPEFVFPAIR